ncbi:probable splicing factor YJU2B [Schistocerca gregaria]|uniref:probable splicing factor YJU2B n=1 Tax=Schistocerca gregaria TaxID=7010 RepID=UPI00211F1C63|nr:probable splicing factor YJU2B [Schistocerca gregaria]
MAERKSSTKYYPPEWNPEKGSVNKFHGKHPYGSRARKLDKGILVIRFEMPWNMWCNHCGDMIPRGRRFNAEKQKTGAYLSSPIFSFSFRCNRCAGTLVIRTDPKTSDFVVVEGGRRKVEWVESEDGKVEEELGACITNLESLSRAPDKPVDPFEFVEQIYDNSDSKSSPIEEGPSYDFESVAHQRYDDSVANNRLLRSMMRRERKKIKILEEETRKRGLGITLLPFIEEDEKEAQETFNRISSERASQVVSSNSSCCLKSCIDSSSILTGVQSLKREKVVSKLRRQGLDWTILKKKQMPLTSTKLGLKHTKFMSVIGPAVKGKDNFEVQK